MKLTRRHLDGGCILKGGWVVCLSFAVAPMALSIADLKLKVGSIEIWVLQSILRGSAQPFKSERCGDHGLRSLRSSC